MVAGNRELIVGMLRDRQFGPTVMLGVGGILAEAVADVVFRPAPLDRPTAAEMIDDLASQKLLGAFRGDAEVQRERLVDLLVGLGTLAVERPDVTSVDVNPLIVGHDGMPVAVDALVEIGHGAEPRPRSRPRPTVEQFDALFSPRGVLVTGASTHPGKFGFVSLHNLLAGGYPGRVFGTNLQGEEVLGVRTVADIADLPDGAVDLVFVCTPAAANPEILRACAAKGVRAAFLTSAGYGEAGDAGRAAERELVALADELGILLAGPNGQGVVSTPARLCAQIVAPYPPAGRIAVASQSGNFVSSFMNLARRHRRRHQPRRLGRQRGGRVGRRLPRLLRRRPGDVGRAGVHRGDHRRLRADVAARRRGPAQAARRAQGWRHRGRCAGGRQPHGSAGRRRQGVRRRVPGGGHHAGDDGRGGVRGGGHVRHAAAAGRPERRRAHDGRRMGCRDGRRDHEGATGCVLLPLPDDLRDAVDAKLPPRWSRNNPVDCAGGETRDTIPEVMELIALHPDVHAIVYLGLGIQSNQARMMREGGFYPDHGLERIVAYHERQDVRFAEAAEELIERTGKPILVATELAVADPANPGPAAVRASGRLCYPSGERAVAALGHLRRYAAYRERRPS